MLRRLLTFVDSPKAFWIYLGICFTESSFFLIPPDVMMIPMGIQDPKNVYRLAFWGTVTSVLGGLLGYIIGFYFMQSAGQWVLTTYGLTEKAALFHQSYHDYGFWIIILKGLTPIPYKLVTIASGMAHYPLAPFMVASVIARGFRFYLVAFLVHRFGDQARFMMERHLLTLGIASVLIVILGFFMVQWFT